MKNIIPWRIFCLLIMINLFGCKKNKKEVTKNKRSENFLEFYYLGPNMTFTHSVDCWAISDKEFRKGVNYKISYDEHQFQKFIHLYNKYEASEDSSGIDARIKVIVHHKKEIDTLCLGECGSTYLNGVKMNDSKELLMLVKKIIDFNNTLPRHIKEHAERYNVKRVPDTFDPCSL